MISGNRCGNRSWFYPAVWDVVLDIPHMPLDSARPRPGAPVIVSTRRRRTDSMGRTKSTKPPWRPTARPRRNACSTPCAGAVLTRGVVRWRRLRREQATSARPRSPEVRRHVEGRRPMGRIPAGGVAVPSRGTAGTGESFSAATWTSALCRTLRVGNTRTVPA